MDDNWGYLYLGNPQAFHVDVPFEQRLPIEVPHCAHGLRLSQGGQVATGAVANGVDLPHAGVLIPHSEKYTKKRRMEVYPKMDEHVDRFYIKLNIWMIWGTTYFRTPPSLFNWDLNKSTLRE